MLNTKSNSEQMVKSQLLSGKKSIITMCAIFIATFSACAQEKHEHHDKKDAPAATTTAEPIVNVSDAKSAAAIGTIVEHYLHLKNALAADNGKEAATAGTALEAAFKKFDKKDLTAPQQKAYTDIEDDAREHAEHIGANAGDIDHQREHFDMLSKDVYDLVTAFGSPQPLYKDYCPMYNDKKGAIWLSEAKPIKNPYYGKMMLSCGSVKEEIK